MKIIDLLNKIANGEEVPKKIIAGDSETEYYFNKELKDYINLKTEEKLFEDEIGKLLKYYINDEVEILEEEKKIPEKLNTWFGIVPVSLDSPTTFKDNSKYIDFNAEMFFDKINEIIDYLDYLKSKGDE